MPVVFGTVTRRPVRRGARRALTLAALTVVAVPLFSSTAFAATQGGSRIGTKYNPDPLSILDSFLIYGGTIVGGFAVAIILTALSERKKSSRYRPGQPWQHDSVWVGGTPTQATAEETAAEEGETTATAPGSGGASGKW